MSTETEAGKEESEDNFKLSNRGNKLTGEENPNSLRRPKMWPGRTRFNMRENETDFEVLKGSINYSGGINHRFLLFL